MTKADLVLSLLEVHFAALTAWNPPKPQQESLAPGYFNAFVATKEKFLHAAFLKLMKHEEADLNVALGVSTMRSIAGVLNEHPINLELKAMVPPRLPPWFSEGFQIEGGEPDYRYWVQKREWLNSEFVALSLGFDPSLLVDASDNLKHVPEAVRQKLMKQGDVIDSHYHSKFPHYLDRTPVGYCTWASKLKLEVAERLLIEVDSVHDTRFAKIPPKGVKQDGRFDNRERETLVKLVIGLAIGGYGYDPASERSKSPAEIQGDLDRIGLNCDIKTLRKYLNEGRKFLPKED